MHTKAATLIFRWRCSATLGNVYLAVSLAREIFASEYKNRRRDCLGKFSGVRIVLADFYLRFYLFSDKGNGSEFGMIIGLVYFVNFQEERYLR